MSENFDSNLIIEIKVSYLTVAVLGVAHLGAGLLAMTVPLPWLARFALWGLLAVSLVGTARRHGWRAGPGAVTGLELDREGLCALRGGHSGGWRNGEIVRALVHPWGVLLTVRLDGRRRPAYVTIPADAVAAEPFRRLRARLRLESRAA